MEDEVSLRDLYLILKRSSKWIVGFTVAVAVLVYLVSSLLPPKYESEAVAQALVLQQNDNALSFPAAASVFRTLPDAAALGVGFNKQLETKGPYVTRVLGDAPVEVSARFDDKKNLLTLTVRGNDPAEVKQFAEALLAAFDDYVKDRVFQSAG
ncbi:Wzz/FepE/Etk N-terminal domain-containing protein, partial [Oceanithermus sp.]